MKLLFDNNLAQRLVVSLESLYPDSQHVRALGQLTGCQHERRSIRAYRTNTIREQPVIDRVNMSGNQLHLSAHLKTCLISLVISSLAFSAASSSLASDRTNLDPEIVTEIEKNSKEADKQDISDKEQRLWS